jgi:hypothetical protein
LKRTSIFSLFVVALPPSQTPARFNAAFSAPQVSRVDNLRLTAFAFAVPEKHVAWSLDAFLLDACKHDDGQFSVFQTDQIFCVAKSFHCVTLNTLSSIPFAHFAESSIRFSSPAIVACCSSITLLCSLLCASSCIIFSLIDSTAAKASRALPDAKLQIALSPRVSVRICRTSATIASIRGSVFLRASMDSRRRCVADWWSVTRYLSLYGFASREQLPTNEP